MKSLEELKFIRDKALKQIDLRGQNKGTRIVVGMATCGISAGAREVLNILIDEVAAHALGDVEVVMTGCIGVCTMEPIVEVYSADMRKITYVNINPDKAKRIIEQHIKKGQIVEEFLIDAGRE